MTTLTQYSIFIAMFPAGPKGFCSPQNSSEAYLSSYNMYVRSSFLGSRIGVARTWPLTSI